MLRLNVEQDKTDTQQNIYTAKVTYEKTKYQNICRFWIIQAEVLLNLVNCSGTTELSFTCDKMKSGKIEILIHFEGENLHYCTGDKQENSKELEFKLLNIWRLFFSPRFFENYFTPHFVIDFQNSLKLSWNMLQERTSKRRTQSKPLCVFLWWPRANATLEKERGVLRKYCPLFKMTK